MKLKRSRRRRRTKTDWYTWKSKSLAASFNKRFKDLGDSSRLSSKQIKTWLVDVPLICHYCTIKLDQKNFGVDHAIAIARGGTNTVSNLRQCCRGCNIAKGAYSEDQFKELLALISKWDDGGKALLAQLKRGFAFYRK